VPDAIRALAAGEPIKLRNPEATRPWQHVLEPLGGYLLLAEGLTASAELEEALLHWPGRWQDHSDPQAPHEASLLQLQIDKVHHELGWSPRWDFSTTVERTVSWYRQLQEGEVKAMNCCLADLAAYLG